MRFTWISDFEPYISKSLIPKAGYVVERNISKNGRSDVVLARSKLTNHAICLKTIRIPDGKAGKAVQNELTVAFGLSDFHTPHPRLVCVYEWFWDSCSVPSVVIVMEYCDLSLEHFLSRVRYLRNSVVSLSAVVVLFTDILGALCFLEFERILHQDLKPSNILWKRENVWKLSDFGSMRRLSHQSDRPGIFEGTLSTSSPESLMGRSCSKSDIWSFGCVIWEVVTLIRPFRIVDLTSFQNSGKLCRDFPIDLYFKNQHQSIGRKRLKSLIRKHLLIPESNSRPTASEIHQTDLINILIPPHGHNTYGMFPSDAL